MTWAASVRMEVPIRPTCKDDGHGYVANIWEVGRYLKDFSVFKHLPYYQLLEYYFT